MCLYSLIYVYPVILEKGNARGQFGSLAATSYLGLIVGSQMYLNTAVDFGLILENMAKNHLKFDNVLDQSDTSVMLMTKGKKTWKFNYLNAPFYNYFKKELVKGDNESDGVTTVV